MSEPARILAIGWYGEGNLGDEAMLEGTLRLLGRAVGPIRATVATSDPEGTARLHGTAVIRRSSPAASNFRDFGLVRASLRADLVTLGGGDLIREQADGTVPALNWLSRLRVPLRLRRPTALLGVSVGELFSPAVVDAVGTHLQALGVIAARDSSSAARLADLSGRDVRVMGDLALEALDPVEPAPFPRPAGHPPRIGVAIRDIVGRGPSVPNSMTGTLREHLAAALDRLVDSAGAQVELVPFRDRGSRRRRDDDVEAGESLAALARSGGTWIRHPCPRRASEFGVIAAGLDLVLAIRLHGAVLGAAAGRPVIGIAYDSKVRGFLDDLGLPGQVLPLDASPHEIELTALRTLDDPTQSARVRAGVIEARSRTRAIEPLLAQLARGG